MATLPENAALETPAVPQRQPSLTWNIDKQTNRIRGEADGLAAAHQAVEIILNCERFRWQIYRPYSGVQWDGLIGEDPGYVSAQLLRRVTEALMMDDRVTGVTDFSPAVSGSTLTASMTVRTVYGDTRAQVQVELG